MERAIASLAMVKVEYSKQRKDYIENFLPFVATLVKRKNYSEIDLDNLQPFLDDFTQEFGLLIPYHPMLTILKRAKTRFMFNQAISKLIPQRDVILKYDFSDTEIIK